MATDPTAEVTAEPDLAPPVQMSVQLASQPSARLPRSPDLFRSPATTPEASRWSKALASLEDAELRGASADVLQILQETVIAARLAMLRAAERAGSRIDPAARRQLERDRELLRRFPGDRSGDGGVGWFEWPLNT